MVMLSPEINRFLGRALLDPDLRSAVFGGDRVVALKSYNLRPEEQATILASHALTLAELSHELVASFGRPGALEAEAQIQRLNERLQARSRANAGSVRSLVDLATRSVPLHEKDEIVPTGTD